ncbi:Structure-specific endonuclease subunit slx1 [Melia azedarach]|uniref:Structure-specific endonuclease subunit slx1 n=1 Tax=Melia azedarach TaxID=155640 RepID=A0ACC1XJY6_MELAZ|nr:Structure-specific endonuclease subunit slx1 [Melia azedarach]
MTTLSRTFRSVKLTKPNPLKLASAFSSASSSATPRRLQSQAKPSPNSKSKSRSWSVYLIFATNAPIKTYVGVTTNFSRRLKQHNGELKGGAKASQTGRPWVLACIIGGFHDQSEACEFESKWKSTSRKLPRKRKSEETANQIDDASLLLLQHRHTALDRVKTLFDCSHLRIDWKFNPL